MKLRQKLAAVLAATMVVTAVPAMAKSDFALTNGIVVLEKDKTLVEKSKTQNLKVEVKDGVTLTGGQTTSAVFFVNIANAEWQDAASTTVTVGGNTIVYQKNNKTELQVEVQGSLAGTEVFSIPLDNVKLTGGDATVAVDGNGTVISDMAPVVFAKTSDSKSTVTFGDAKNIYKVGTVGEITIEEPLVDTMDASEWITLELDNTDYQFVGNGTTPNGFTAEWSKGFSGNGGVVGLQYGQFSDGTKDYSTIQFKLSGESTSAPGRLKIKDLEIKLKPNKTFVANDDINLTVKGEKITETTGKVAVAQELGCSIEMKDKEVVEIVAGKAKEVEFTVAENVNDSMLNRMMEVRIENAFFYDGETTLANLTTATPVTNERQEMKITTKFASDTEYTQGGSNTFATLGLEWIKDKDDKVIGFDFTVPAGTRANDIDKIVFSKVKIFAPVENTGDVKITVNGRSVGSELSTVAANIIAPVEIEEEVFTAKVGLKEQVGGKLVIKETDKARFANNKEIRIAFDKKDDGFEFTGKPVVEVTEGDLKLDLDKMDYEAGYITIPVSRASKTASTIEIKDFKVKVDRTVPQGKYDLKVDGPALETGCAMGALTVEDFFNVATANTEDITTNNGLRKVTTSFVIGSAKYLINGTEAEMDAVAYLDPAGRTMVPLRYVANALGIDDKEIYFANNTATIVAGSKTISVEIGSKTAKLNGVAVRTMDTAPVLKNSRTYVPVGEIAALLGVEAKWDGETKTATFINE